MPIPCSSPCIRRQEPSLPGSSRAASHSKEKANVMWNIDLTCLEGSWLTERQMMSFRGVFHHLRNGRYVGSMLPFSVSVSQDP